MTIIVTCCLAASSSGSHSSRDRGSIPTTRIRQVKAHIINDPPLFFLLWIALARTVKHCMLTSLFLQKIGRDRRERGRKGRREKHRKQPRGNGSTKSILSS